MDVQVPLRSATGASAPLGELGMCLSISAVPAALAPMSEFLEG